MKATYGEVFWETNMTWCRALLESLHCQTPLRIEHGLHIHSNNAFHDGIYGDLFQRRGSNNSWLNAATVEGQCWKQPEVFAAARHMCRKVSRIGGDNRHELVAANKHGIPSTSHNATNKEQLTVVMWGKCASKMSKLGNCIIKSSNFTPHTSRLPYYA